LPKELEEHKTTNNKDALSRARVWGAPTYVLSPKLQDSHKLPKFQPRSHQGIYLGFSPRHSTTVGRILNPQTGHISPQYHIVVDEQFSTVMSSRFDHELFDGPTLNRLVQTGLEKVLDPEDMDGETVPFADWFDEWVGSSDVASPDSSTSVSEGEDVDEVPASAPTTTNETPVSERAPLEPPSRPSTTQSGRC